MYNSQSVPSLRRKRRALSGFKGLLEIVGLVMMVVVCLHVPILLVGGQEGYLASKKCVCRHCRQITMPSPHSVFLMSDALPAFQPTVSKH